MKKILSVVLTLALLMSVLVVPVHAVDEDKVVLEIGEMYVDSGYLVVPILVSESNTDIAVGKFTIISDQKLPSYYAEKGTISDTYLPKIGGPQSYGFAYTFGVNSEMTEENNLLHNGAYANIVVTSTYDLLGVTTTGLLATLYFTLPAGVTSAEGYTFTLGEESQSVNQEMGLAKLSLKQKLPPEPCKHPTTKEEVTKAPSCTETGLKDIRCAECNELLQKDVVVLALGHLGNTVVRTVPATDDTVGYTLYNCSRPGCTEHYYTDLNGKFPYEDVPGNEVVSLSFGDLSVVEGYLAVPVYIVKNASNIYAAKVTVVSDQNLPSYFGEGGTIKDSYKSPMGATTEYGFSYTIGVNSDMTPAANLLHNGAYANIVVDSTYDKDGVKTTGLLATLYFELPDGVTSAKGYTFSLGEETQFTTQNKQFLEYAVATREYTPVDIVYSEATCMGKGITDTVDTLTGSVLSFSETDALGHDFTKFVKHVDITPTSAGYDLYQCSRCEETTHKNEIAYQSIAVQQLPTKVTYLEGKETLSVTGGKVRINYSNSTYEDVDLTAAMVSGFDNTKVGKQTLTVTHVGKTTTFDITIKAKSLSSIAVTTLPTVTEYLEGKDALSVTGGKVKLTYDNGTTETIDLTASMVSGFDNTKVGQQPLTVTYGGKTTTFNVTIRSKAVNSIAVTTLPTVTEYLEAKDTLNVAGGKLKVTYDNGTDATIDLTASMVSGFDNTKVGQQALTVTYGNKTTTFNVTIKAKSLTGIAVTTLPTKTEYLEAKDTLNVAGGKVKLTYDNDTTETIDLTSAMVSGFDNTKVGEQSLTVTYEGKTTAFNVTIKAKSLASIIVTTLPTVSEYVEGKDTLDVTGGKLKLSYDNGTFETIDLTGSMVSGFDNTKVGEQTLTVTYKGKSTTFKVTVKPAKLLGDANGDNLVDTGDLVHIKKFLAGLVEESDCSAGVDANNDGVVDTADLVDLKKFLAGLIEELGV